MRAAAWGLRCHGDLLNRGEVYLQDCPRASIECRADESYGGRRAVGNSPNLIRLVVRQRIEIAYIHDEELLIRDVNHTAAGDAVLGKFRYDDFVFIAPSQVDANE